VKRGKLPFSKWKKRREKEESMGIAYILFPGKLGGSGGKNDSFFARKESCPAPA